MNSIASGLTDCNSVFEALQQHARFYPIRPDKSPACGKLDREATTDTKKIQTWRRQHVGMAARINAGSRLFVLDIESPYKHAGSIGPDGMMRLCSLLDDHDITLPEAPTTMTCNGGHHIYLLAPEGMTVEASIGAFPGVDVLAAGSNVILPGSTVKAGQYTTLRGFDECAIPEAPREFVELLWAAGKRRRRVQQANLDLPDGDGANVSNRQWFLLRRSKIFRAMWERRKLYGDKTNSAMEFHMAKFAFCCGLNVEQIVTVMRCWWAEHRLRKREKKLRKAIIPAAWAEVAERVQAWQASHRQLRGNTIPPGADALLLSKRGGAESWPWTV